MFASPAAGHPGDPGLTRERPTPGGDSLHKRLPAKRRAAAALRVHIAQGVSPWAAASAGAARHTAHRQTTASQVRKDDETRRKSTRKERRKIPLWQDRPCSAGLGISLAPCFSAERLTAVPRRPICTSKGAIWRQVRCRKCVSTRNQGSKPAAAWEVEVGGNLVETARAVGVSLEAQPSAVRLLAPIQRHLLPPSDIPFSVGLSSHGRVRQIRSVNNNRRMRLETNPVTGRAVIVLSLYKYVPGRPASENGPWAGGEQRGPPTTTAGARGSLSQPSCPANVEG